MSKIVALIPNETIGPFVQFGEFYFRYCEIHNLNKKKDLILMAKNNSINLFYEKRIKENFNCIVNSTMYQESVNGGYKAMNRNVYFVDSFGYGFY